MELPFASQAKAWMEQLPGLQKMFRGSMTSVGLDVGSSMVKGVKVIWKEGRLELLQKETAVVPHGSQPPVVRAILQKLLQKLDLRDTLVVTAVGGSGVVLRSILMPKMSLTELRGAFNYEAEKYIPFRPDEAFLDFVVLGDRPGGRMEVLLAAARRELVKNHLDLLKRVDVAPDVLDLETVALANAWEASRSQQTSGLVGLLHVGARGTLLDFIDGHQLQFAREIPVGGDTFTQAVAKSLDLDLASAEKTKQETQGTSKQMQTVLAPAWEEWLDQCRVSFDFYENQFGRGVERLVLSGGSARLEGFSSWVEKATGLPTEVWNPMAVFGQSGGGGKPQGLDAAMGIAVGLAVRGVKG